VPLRLCLARYGPPAHDAAAGDASQGRADLVLRSADLAELAPGVDPAHQLVAVGHGGTADTVLVNGRVVLRGGRPTQVEMGAVAEAARASVSRMSARLGISPPSPWPRAA